MLKMKCQQLSQKLAELGVEADQHRAVLDTLKTMAPERKCFRLVGGVLIERVVGETVPELETTHSGVRTAQRSPRCRRFLPPARRPVALLTTRSHRCPLYPTHRS